jgi:hypothetical protein
VEAVEVADGTAFPYAEDLDGVWHRRADDEWIPATVADTQCSTVCGIRIGSVRVSEPAPDAADGDQVCAGCFR